MFDCIDIQKIGARCFNIWKQTHKSVATLASWSKFILTHSYVKCKLEFISFVWKSLFSLLFMLISYFPPSRFPITLKPNQLRAETQLRYTHAHKHHIKPCSFNCVGSNAKHFCLDWINVKSSRDVRLKYVVIDYSEYFQSLFFLKNKLKCNDNGVWFFLREHFFKTTNANNCKVAMFLFTNIHPGTPLAPYANALPQAV